MARNYFPKELIVEILTKLPVKSLVRFKSLSKSYHTLITNKFFSTKHFSCSIIASRNRPNLFFSKFKKNFSIIFFPNNELLQSSVDLEPPYPFPRYLVDHVTAYGPCNGIIFLEVGVLGHPDQFMLWNPATREIKVLPMAQEVDYSIWKEFIEVHGFGVDPMKNDYKIVKIVAGVKLDMEHDQHPSAQVYNLDTNSWKMVNVNIPPNNLIQPTHSSYLNGNYHWLSEYGTDKSILCFDMSNDVFWKMNLPLISQAAGTNDKLMDSDVAILNDSVALIKEYMLQSSLATRVEIWVMNEYGVEGSWTKRFTIGPLLQSWKFWGFWRDDEVLLAGQDHKKLVLYNVMIQKPVRELPIPVGEMCHAFIYVESVVPLS